MVSLALVLVLPFFCVLASADKEDLPFEVPYGVPMWFELKDFDEKGDVLELEIVYKNNPSIAERPIQMFIIESSRVYGTPRLEDVEQFAAYHSNFTVRHVKEYKNNKDAQMTILFFNEKMDGDDLKDEANTTIEMRIVYDVRNASTEEDSSLLMILLVFFLVLIVIGLLVLGFFFIRRRLRDSTSFFSSEQPVFYVFKDIDGAVYYFTPEQYAKMYSSHSLTTYEYLGQAMKKGGPLIAGGQFQYQMDQQFFPMEAMPMSPAPIESQPLIPPAEAYAGLPQEVQAQNDPIEEQPQGDISEENGEEADQVPETAAPEGPQDTEVDKLGDLFDDEEPGQDLEAQEPPESSPDVNNEVQGNGQQPPLPEEMGSREQEGTAEGEVDTGQYAGGDDQPAPQVEEPDPN
ncbi:MAG: hypothetical protein ACMUIE_00380 [Thermoplasmatota archaeon]